MDESFCYVAAETGKPGYFAACIDRPEYKKATAKDVAGWLRRSATITRVTTDEANHGLREWLQAKRAAELFANTASNASECP